MSVPIYFECHKTTGKNTPLAHMVLIHGWGMNASVWDSLLPELLPNYELTLVDLPGFGRSKMSDEHYSLDFLAQSVLKVAPEKALWLGWSLGGLVATHAAISAPNRVQALINLASTPCWIKKNNWSYALSEKLLRDFDRRLTDNAHHALTRFLALQCKDSDSIRESIRYVRDRAFLHGTPALEALKKGLNLLIHTDLREKLTELTMPVSYWLGERDSLIPLGVIEQLQLLSPDAHIHEIPGTSHVPFVAHTELWMPELQQWIYSLNLPSVSSL